MDLIKYENLFPDKRFTALIQQLFDQEEDEINLQLVISFSEKKLNLKQFGDLCHFIYRVDGKIYKYGFGSYAHIPEVQITSSFHFGSLELILDTLKDQIDPQTLIIIWLALKYAPGLMTSASESLVNFSQTLKNWNEYQRGNLEIRRGRKEIRKLVNEDEDLENIDQKNKEKLIKLLQEIYDDNYKQLPGVIRLLRAKLKDIKLRNK